MLRNTFCHVPGIGLQSENRIWASGLRSWDDFLGKRPDRLPAATKRFSSLRRYIEQSMEELQHNRPSYFSDLLPAAQQWRLFNEFRESTAYLDIETTGTGSLGDHITTIALYDGESIFHYVRGQNLDAFKKRIRNYKMIVTYNGKCFDVPFIRNTLRVELDQAHIDLRYVLNSLGYRGGLKNCEKHLGIDRDELDGVDGFFAVLLWHDYVHNRNQRALETLLAYNIMDVVNLERLMILAYNLKLQDTPFVESHTLPMPSSPQIPFTADLDTIERIRSSYGIMGF